jgi:hypothetical protein
VLPLNKKTQQQQQQQQQQPEYKQSQSSRRGTSQEEEVSLAQTILQAIAATPGYENLSDSELEAAGEGLLEFARLAHSIFQNSLQQESINDQAINLK